MVQISPLSGQFGEQFGFFFGIGWAFLPALLDKDKARIGLIRIDEMAESLELLVVFYRRFPLTLISADDLRHLAL
jgi:hypothetical protein